MELRAGYKQTDAGVVPITWQVSALRDLVGYVKGFPFRASDYQQHGIRIVRVSDTKADGIRQDVGVFIASSKAFQFRRWALRESDLIVSTVGSKPPMYDSMVGKATLATTRDTGSLLNQNAVILRSKNWSTHAQKILHSHFQQERYIKHLESIFRGNANQASITLHELFGYPIAIPSDENEQRAIATVLSDVDALLSKLDQLITKKRDLKQAAMQQLLTGQTRLPGFSGEWGEKRLGDIAIASKGSQLPNSESSDSGNYAHLNGGVTPSSYTANANTPGETIAISEGGNSCGFVQFMKDPYWCGGHCYSVTPRGVDNAYLYQALKGRQSEIMDLRVGSGLPNIQKSALLNFVVSLPADKFEQTTIATVLSDMDAELTALEARRDKTHALRQGMMQVLLTGRIRLI